MDIEDYATSHPNVNASKWPPLLEKTVSPGKIIDLGCGDGSNLKLLMSKDLLTFAWAVDLSANRVASAIKLSPNIEGIVADATNVSELTSGCADGIIASQLIEHIPVRGKLIEEMHRLLKPGAWWYVGSVARGKRAWWLYKVNGVRRLDPTHTYEYEDLEDFLKDVDFPGMKLTETNVQPVKYALKDLTINFSESSMFTRRILGRCIRLFGWINIRVPGYTLVEASGIKQ